MHGGLAAQRAERVQYKHGNVGIKLFAIFSHTKIATVHRARRRAQAAAAGVLKTLTGFQQWLLAHYAQTLNFVVAAVGIVNAPSARDQLGRYLAGVGNSDGIRKGVHPLLRRGLVGQVLGLYLNAELVLGHGDMVQLSLGGWTAFWQGV
jgi:hypothetical protein